MDRTNFEFHHLITKLKLKHLILFHEGDELSLYTCYSCPFFAYRDKFSMMCRHRRRNCPQCLYAQIYACPKSTYRQVGGLSICSSNLDLISNFIGKIASTTSMPFCSCLCRCTNLRSNKVELVPELQLEGCVA